MSKPKVKEVAEKDPMIEKEWQNAKKGNVSITEVYDKAQIIEDISTLSAPYKHKIRAELESKDKSIKQIKSEIQDKKDDLKRTEIASRDRALEKKKEEMEKLHLKITGLNNTILELINASKSSDARLKILSDEAIERLPQFKSDDPAYVLTNMSIHYDTLDQARGPPESGRGSMAPRTINVKGIEFDASTGHPIFYRNRLEFYTPVYK